MGPASLGGDTPAAEPQRLHPASLVFSFGKTARTMLVPALLAAFAGRGSGWEVFILVLFPFSAGLALLRYFTLTWTLGAEELVVREGLFFKRERHVPYERIQNVDLVQNVLHRLFRVAEVRVETASGGAPEAVLDVLKLSDVEVIRSRVVAERGKGGIPPAEVPPAEVPPAGMEPAASAASAVAAETTTRAGDSAAGDLILRVPTGQLVILGLILNRGLALIGAGLYLLNELELVEPLLKRVGLEQWFNGLLAAGLSGALLQVLLLIAGGYVVVLGLSIVWSVVRFYGFTLSRAGEDLRLRCGLWTRVSASIPRHRIQALIVRESWLQRRLDYASIQAQTAGGLGVGEDVGDLMRRRFVPILPAAEAPAVLRRVVPAITGGDPAWQALSASAAGRVRRRLIIVLSLLLLPVAYFSLYALIAWAGGVAWAWWYGGASIRRSRFALTSWGLLWQRGVLTRETTYLPGDKVQVVGLVQSPFDRRRGHFTLRVDAAGGSARASEIRIRYLDAEVADGLAASLFEAAAGSEYGLRRVAPAV